MSCACGVVFGALLGMVPTCHSSLQRSALFCFLHSSHWFSSRFPNMLLLSQSLRPIVPSACDSLLSLLPGSSYQSFSSQLKCDFFLKHFLDLIWDLRTKVILWVHLSSGFQTYDQTEVF